MAVLKAKARKALPDTTFALPHKRAYPLPDENHARSALSLLHNASSTEQGMIKRAVARKFPSINIDGETSKIPKSDGK